MYQTYCNQHKRANDMVSKLQKSNNAFRRFVQRKEKRSQQYGTLASLLIRPVQRILKYRLLLQEIIKNTPMMDTAPHEGASGSSQSESEPNRNNKKQELEQLQKALQIVSRITSTINTRLEEYERRQVSILYIIH